MLVVIAVDTLESPRRKESTPWRIQKRTSKSKLDHRFGTVTKCSASISVRAQRSRGLPAERMSMCAVEIEGNFIEPISGQSLFSILAYGDADVGVGNADVSSVGAITSMKPVVSRQVSNYRGTSSKRFLTLVSTGQLRSCRVAFTKPRWGSALIVSLDFNTKTPEEYDT